MIIDITITVNSGGLTKRRRVDGLTGQTTGQCGDDGSAAPTQSLTHIVGAQALMTALGVNADSLPRVFCIDSF